MSTYVIPLEMLPQMQPAIADLGDAVQLEWINRGTDQKLRPGTIQELLRTWDRRNRVSRGLQRLHSWAGIRMIFDHDDDKRLVLSRLGLIQHGKNAA